MKCRVVLHSALRLTILISAIAKSRDLFQGEQIHCLVNKTGFCDECCWLLCWIFYAKCGKIEELAWFFREIPNKNNVTRGAMMLGFVQNGYIKDAINLFVQMQAAILSPGLRFWEAFLILLNFPLISVGLTYGIFNILNGR